MAGNYPDVPAPRMAYDRDGTVGLNIATGYGSVVSQLSAGTLLALNDETSTNAVTGNGICIIFPELRDIRGMLIRYLETSTGSQPSISASQWSANTTNGIDGSWTSMGTIGAYGAGDPVQYRQQIQALNLNGVKGIRWAQGGGGATITYRTVHIYGVIAAAQNPDRLRMWHPTLDEPLDDATAADGAHLDWAEAVRGTTQDRTFRIKNNSATLTANSIDLTVNVPTDTSPTVASQHTLSDGGAFAGTINIGNLAPGTISSVITLRRTTASNAALSLWTGRINVNPGSWT